MKDERSNILEERCRGTCELLYRRFGHAPCVAGTPGPLYCQHLKVAFEARYESLASAGMEGVLAPMVFSLAVGDTNG